MSIDNETRRSPSYVCNGSLQTFPFAFKVFSAADIKVVLLDTNNVESTLILTTDFSVTLNPDQDTSPGGSVTTTAAYATGNYITLTSQLSNIQPVELTNPGGFYPEIINDALDRATIQIQQLADKLTRAAVLPISGIGGLDPNNLVFGINSSGTQALLKVLTDLSPAALVSPFMASLLGAADATAAKTTLAVPPANPDGNSLTDNSVPLSKLVRGAAGKVLLGMGAGADVAFGDLPFTVALIPAKSLDYAKLDSSVVRRVKSLPNRQQGDFAYSCFMVQLDDDSLLGWGRTIAKSLGVNETGDTYIMASKPVFNIQPPAGVVVEDFIITSTSTYVVMSNGWVYSAGDNTYGQLGHGDTTDRSILTRVEFFNTNSISITKVFAAGSKQTPSLGYAYFVNAAGNVWSCGYNSVGQLGVGDTANKTLPTPLSGSILNASQIVNSSGNSASVFLLLTDGSLYATGYNALGSLGLGDTTNRSAFSLVSLSGVAKISVSGGVNATPTNGVSAIALLNDGTVWACGFNAYGQNGQGTTTPNASSFTQISGLTNVVDIGISGGYFGFCWAVTTAGELYTWGYNGQGVIGDNSTTNRTSPYKVFGWSGNASEAPPFEGKIAQVEACYTNTAHQQLIVLDTDGMLWMSGYDYKFFCADTAGQRARFTPFNPFTLDSPTEKITAIRFHGITTTYRLFCLSDAGKLYAIGDNTSGVCRAGLNGGTPATVKTLQRVPL